MYCVFGTLSEEIGLDQKDTIMIKNFFSTAFRTLRKQKLFTFIHVFGLSLAFTVAVILFLTAMFEFSYDDFHEKKDRLYQVYLEAHPVSGVDQHSSMPVPLGPAAKAELSGIKNISRYGDNGSLIRFGDKEIDLTVRFVDPDFLNMFSFPFIQGEKTSALNELNNIVLTENTVKKLFGNTEAVGKQVEINAEGEWEPYLISGVLKDVPNNSSLEIDALLRFEKFPPYRDYTDEWYANSHGVFIELQENSLASSFERESQAFIDKNFASGIESLKREGAQLNEQGVYISLHLIPLTNLHFSKISVGTRATTPLYPWILLAIGLLVLFIACTNFINLSLASSFTRGKEIGMRKTLGASKFQVVFQFWSEAMLVCLFSCILGLVLAWLLLPIFNTAMGYRLEFIQLATLKNAVLLLFTFVIITLFAGGHPAWVVSNFNTITILKGKLNLGTKNGLRNALSIGQFSIAIVLIIATMVTIKQIDFIQNKPLGYTETEVISIPIGNNMNSGFALERMRTELAALPMVESVSASSVNMGRGKDGTRSRTQIGFYYKDHSVTTDLMRVDYDYLNTMQIELLAGRDFSGNYPTDVEAVVINQQMAAQLGEEDPIGTIIPFNDEISLKVIGVVKDFNTQTLHQKIAPMSMHLLPAAGSIDYIFVRVKPESLTNALQSIEKIWKTINPKAVAAASFLDENTQREYKKEERFSKIIIGGAILAILISCMGLFALALLMMNQRVKEIGVRKVLGAKVSTIVLLLSKDFARLIGIAFLIAAPIAWWVMSSWLEDFAYRIHLNAGILLLGGVLVLLVALLTVISQSLRAAMVNPVKSLRSE